MTQPKFISASIGVSKVTFEFASSDEAQAFLDIQMGEYLYRQRCETRDPEEQPEGTLEALQTCATMLRDYSVDCCPPNLEGQVNFCRVIMEATADEIEAFAAKANAG